MQLPALLMGLIVASSTMIVAAEPVPISPIDAAKKVNEMVVVEMKVKSSGGNNNHYLNSEEDYKDPKNFTIFIAKENLPKFQKAGIDEPMEYYKDKLIHVSGKVVLEQKKPRINVNHPDQIKVVTKKE